jgi:hypothetical protein
MDFEPGHWLSIIQTYPVVWIIGGGLFCGSGITQIAKQVYLAFWPEQVSVKRYKVSVKLLSLASTLCATHYFWIYGVPVAGHGLGWITSITTGFSAQYAYSLTKAGIAWKFPGLAAKLGDQR